MFSNYTEKTKEMQLLTELRSPFQRSEQHERSCKLRHIVIFTHNAIRRVANLLCVGAERRTSKLFPPVMRS